MSHDGHKYYAMPGCRWVKRHLVVERLVSASTTPKLSRRDQALFSHVGIARWQCCMHTLIYS